MNIDPNGITIPQKPKPKDPKGIEALSEREFQVLYLIASGLSIKQICDRLDLAKQTVHTYRLRIKGKLDVDNNVQMAIRAVKEGIISYE